MKKAYLLALLLLAACHPLHWQPFAVDAQVTVELPGPPQPTDARAFSKLKHPELVQSWGCVVRANDHVAKKRGVATAGLVRLPGFGSVPAAHFHQVGRGF